MGKKRLLDAGWSWASRKWGTDGGKAGLSVLFPLDPPRSLPPPPILQMGKLRPDTPCPHQHPKASAQWGSSHPPGATHSPNRYRPSSQRAGRRAGGGPSPSAPSPPLPLSPPSSPHPRRRGTQGTRPVEGGRGGLPGRAAPFPTLFWVGALQFTRGPRRVVPLLARGLHSSHEKGF